MSLADKVVKNTAYYVLAQLFGFIFPLILTPYILSSIGEVQFGLYALILGFIGLFNLFDLSISSSFVVFISRYNVNRDYKNLNEYFNTGLIFYILVSLLIAGAAYFFSGPLLSLLNIPPELQDLASNVYNIGLIIFIISGTFMIFTSVLISIQKMYITSAVALTAGFINLILTVIALKSGYGLTGIMWVQLISVLLTNIMYAILAKKHLSELKVSLFHTRIAPLKEMSKFGVQMQVSKLATFAAEKYDEFLLAYFSVLNNVTYFNVANRITRIGRLVPFQIIPQIAPVASELKAKNDDQKLKELYTDSAKYLTLTAVPVFIFLFVFSDLLIFTWLGEGYELSSYILKILVIGQLVNMSISAPGNSVIPNTGVPKYQMREGMIFLGINLIVSFLLIKYYGLTGAAIGNVFSTVISSLYLYFVSAKFFSLKTKDIFTEKQLRPLAAGIISGIAAGVVYYFSNKFIYQPQGRISGIICILVLFGFFTSVYILLIKKMKFLDNRDKKLLSKVIIKLIPKKYFQKTVLNVPANQTEYKGETVSIFIVTYNRLGMLKKCVQNIMPTIKNVNYELIIIDNASDDGTVEYLKKIKLTDDRIKVIYNKKNIGINAKSLGAETATGDFIIGIDDDVIMFPEYWIENMIRAYKIIPKLGYLATDVVQDETTTGAKHPPETYYKEVYGDERNSVTLEVGLTGGWCFMIPREVYNDIGKIKTFDDRIFYAEDGDYLNRIINKGYKYGILSGVKVYHATGEFHNKHYMEVFEKKHSDFKRKNPFFYEFSNSIKRMLSFHRLIIKLDEYSKKKI